MCGIYYSLNILIIFLVKEIIREVLKRFFIIKEVREDKLSLWKLEILKENLYEIILLVIIVEYLL